MLLHFLQYFISIHQGALLIPGRF